MWLRKYRIDPRTLEPVLAAYDFIRPLLWGGGGLVGLAAIWFVADLLGTSVQEQRLMAENQALQEELSESRQRVSGLSEQLDNLSETDRELYRLILQADSIPSDVRQVGVGGVDPYAHFDGFSETTSELLRDHAELLDQLERQISLQTASFQYLEALGIKRIEALAQLPAISPTMGGRIASGFGYRLHPILHYRRMHSGLDIAVPRGSPVHATGAGVIEDIGYSNIGYGRYVLIDHPDAGYKTLYGHLDSVLPNIKEGVKVVRGQEIAKSGNTGLSVAPHVHYEVRDHKNNALDPRYFLGPSMTPQQYQELLDRADNLSSLPSLD